MLADGFYYDVGFTAPIYRPPYLLCVAYTGSGLNTQLVASLETMMGVRRTRPTYNFLAVFCRGVGRLLLLYLGPNESRNILAGGWERGGAALFLF